MSLPVFVHLYILILIGIPPLYCKLKNLFYMYL